jgi:hypothetical protein
MFGKQVNGNTIFMIKKTDGFPSSLAVPGCLLQPPSHKFGFIPSEGARILSGKGG